MQNVKEVEIPIQKVVSDTPAGLSELLNLRHDGEDITSLFSELGSKELFQTKGKCYGAIIHADKCYAIHKSDSNAVLVCYMNIDGEVKEVSSTPMSYNSNDLAQMFIVRNELLYLDGREYKQIELPQYTLNEQTTSTTEQKEDFVGCDKLEVSTSSGGGFAHPVKYFVRRRFENGSVSQITGSSLVYVPVNNNLPLKIGEVSNHGFKISITPQISGVVVIYRVYAGSTSLIATLDATAGNAVEFTDESPSLGQAIPDEGVTDSPIVNINGSAVSFWNDRAIIASLSGENGESSISTNIDISSFNIEDRVVIEWKDSIVSNNESLINRFKFGTFVYGETYNFIARVYFSNRVEVIDLGSKECLLKSNNNIICSIKLKDEFRSFLISNNALRVDYGYNSNGIVKNIGISCPTSYNHYNSEQILKNQRFHLVPIEFLRTNALEDEAGIAYDGKIHTFISPKGDVFSISGDLDVFIIPINTYSLNAVLDRTISSIGVKGYEPISFSPNNQVKTGSTKIKQYKNIGNGNILSWVFFMNTNRLMADHKPSSLQDYYVYTDEVFLMFLDPFICKVSLIDKIESNRLYIKLNYSKLYNTLKKVKAHITHCPAQTEGMPLSNKDMTFYSIFKSSISCKDRTTYIYMAGEGFVDINTANYNIFESDEKYARADYIKFSFKDDGDSWANYDWTPVWTSDADCSWSDLPRYDKFRGNSIKGLFDSANSYNITINGFDTNVIEYNEETTISLAYILGSGSRGNNYSICSAVHDLNDNAVLFCEQYYNVKNSYVLSNGGEGENIVNVAIYMKAPSRIPSIYRTDGSYNNTDALSGEHFELNPLYNETISDSVFLDIESKSFVDKSINDIKIYWSLPTSNKTYKPWLSFYQESFKTLDRLGEVLKMFPLGNCLLCVCTDGIQAVFAPAHSMTGENGESIALTNAEFIPSVKTISRQPLTDNPDNVIFANDYVYILSEKQGELIIVSPNLEVKHVASTENCKLLVDSIASANKFRSNKKYSFLSYHYDKNELLLCNQDRSVSYGRFGFEITSYYNTGVGIFVSGTQCIANDDNIMYKLRCDSSCKKILDKQEDIAVSITLNTPYNQGLVVDGLTLDTSYITHTLFDESTAKYRSYRMIAGRNGMNQDNPWQSITIANAYSSTSLPLLEKGDGRHILYAASRFLESILRITIPRVKEVAENAMRLHGNRLYIKLHSKPKARVMLKAISMLIHAFKR